MIIRAEYKRSTIRDANELNRFDHSTFQLSQLTNFPAIRTSFPIISNVYRTFSTIISKIREIKNHRENDQTFSKSLKPKVSIFQLSLASLFVRQSTFQLLLVSFLIISNVSCKSHRVERPFAWDGISISFVL